MAIFENHCALNSKEVLSAVKQSVKKFGIKIIPNSTEADACLIWSVLWNGRMLPNKNIYEKYKQQHKPVIVFDVGALKRNITWKIAVDNINALGYYGHTHNLDNDRPKKLGIQLGQNKPNDQIIIMGQHAKSLAFSPWTSQEDFFNHTVSKLKDYTDRSIILRPHPRSKINPHLLISQAGLQIPKQLMNSYDDFDVDYSYHLVVNHNSGPGIQAGLSGASVLVDSSSLAFPVSISIDQVESLPSLDREKWLIEICHTEYTVSEIENGSWITRLEPWIN